MAIDPDVTTELNKMQTQIDAMPSGGQSQAFTTAVLRVNQKMATKLLPLDDAGRVGYLNQLLTVM